MVVGCKTIVMVEAIAMMTMIARLETGGLTLVTLLLPLLQGPMDTVTAPLIEAGIMAGKEVIGIIAVTIGTSGGAGIIMMVPLLTEGILPLIGQARHHPITNL